MAEINMIFGGSISITSKTQGKKLQREISLAQHIEPGRRMKWSNDYITFGPEDHPIMELSERNLLLIIKIPIGQHKVAKILTDSGASLNLIMRSTFIDMGLNLPDLTPIHDTFYGVIPGQVSTHIGRIDLEVSYGAGENKHRCTKSKGLPISGPLFSKTLRLFTCVALHTKSKGIPIDGLLLSKKLMLFTHVAPRTKRKGLPIGGPLFSKTLRLFTCVAPHTKSKGLLICGPLFSKNLILFIHVAPRTKSKGLPIGGLLFSKKKEHIFTRVAPHTKARGSQSTVHTSSITFSTRFAVYKKHGAP
jgi:hypothetical protein